MILKLLLCVLLLYYMGVLWKYYRHDIAGMFGKDETEEPEDKTGEEPQETEEAYTVIGKSTYRKGQAYEPKDKRGHTENQADKTDNFAAGTPENSTEGAAAEAENKAQPAEETAVADDDADYSDIEVDPDEEEEDYVPAPEELEEEEELGAYYPDGNPDFATGYTFEDLKKVHLIMTADEVNDEEKRQAREVLPAVMGSDVWEEMLDEFEGARQRVARLMNNDKQ